MGEKYEGRRMGGYRLNRKIGSGGMGEVYEGWDETLERVVAVKILPDYLSEDREFIERFLREAKSAASLHHPSICGIYSAGCDDGVYYIAMEFIDGRSHP
jgi:serine/threonine-protein kinase